MTIMCIACLNSSVVEHLLSVQEVQSSILTGSGIFLIYNCSMYYLLCLQHLLPIANLWLLMAFFSLVNKRVCSPGLQHCLNVYSVVLCTLGCSLSSSIIVCAVAHYESLQSTVLQHNQ